MLYLTTKQQRIFEMFYQELSPDQPWRLAELFSRNGEARHIVYDILPQVFMRTFQSGAHVTRPLDVATHEAGHAVVFSAIGYKVGSVWINGASGRTSTSESSIDDEDGGNAIHPVNSMVLQPLAVMEILANCSGFIGETFIKNRRVNIDFHEKFLTYAQCRFLDDQESTKPLTHFNLYTQATKEIIRKNEPLFWSVVDCLLTGGTLTEAKKRRLNAQSVKPPAALFFERVDISKRSDWRYPEGPDRWAGGQIDFEMDRKQSDNSKKAIF